MTEHRTGPRRGALTAICLLLLTVGACSRNVPGLRSDAAPRSPSFDLDLWLTSHPSIAGGVVWEDPNGPPRPYPSWSVAEKSALADMTALIRSGGSPDLPEAPPLATAPDPNGISEGTDLEAGQAWRLFIAYVAQSLAVEIEGTVRWSLSDDDPRRLALLLDSRSVLRWNGRTYDVDPNAGFATPGDPVRTSRFLTANGLLAPTRRETIGRLIEWSRDNLTHFHGGGEAANVYDQWQYYGSPPVERILAGTPLLSDPAEGTRHRTYGCWGTAGFLRAVLRTVNIPVEIVVLCDHALPRFPTEGLSLSHGDDPYNQISRSGPFSAEQLLIDDATFDRWFGAGVPEAGRCRNVGRGVVETALTSPPALVLKKHCEDLAAGRSHEESGVLEIFERARTLPELESGRLWERIEARIGTLGGCAAIP